MGVGIGAVGKLTLRVIKPHERSGIEPEISLLVPNDDVLSEIPKTVAGPKIRLSQKVQLG